MLHGYLQILPQSVTLAVKRRSRFGEITGHDHAKYAAFLTMVAILLVGCQAGSGEISDAANGTTTHILAASKPNMGTLSGHICSDTGVPLAGYT